MSVVNHDEMINKKFERWTVKGYSHKYKGEHFYLCDCDCGTKSKLVKRKYLLNGYSKSCRCYNREMSSEKNKKYNTYDLSGEYGIGWTSNTEEEFYFDLEDYDEIKNYCWSCHRDYVRCNYEKIYLHRLVMNLVNKNTEIDHINHNPMDNRKENLRKCSGSENCRNRMKATNNTSGVKGVSWHKVTNKWMAYIGVSHKLIYLGLFTNIEDAVKVRLEAEEKYHKDFAFNEARINN